MSNKGFCGILSFNRDRISADEIVKVMRDLTVFKPKSFRSNKKDFKRLSNNNFWEQIRINLEQNEYFRSYAKSFYQNPVRLDEISISFFTVTNAVQIRVMVNTNDTDVLKKLENVIACFSEKNIIISASVRTTDEYEWNDDKNPDNQKKRHCELNDIKLIEIGHDKFVDTEQFAGHTHECDGIWFGCSYEMWFGRDYDLYIPISKIIGFSSCSEQKIYKNETVYIRMYDSPDDFKNADSVDRAWKFRTKTECDESAEYWSHKISKMAYEQNQITAEIEKGVFPHGGVKIIRTYLDKNDNPVIKNKAVKIHISELALDGTVMYEELLDLSI